MKILKKTKFDFKKGEKYHLDEVYNLLGLFPGASEDEAYYHQNDIADYNRCEKERINNGAEFKHDAGEFITILRNFSIEYKVKG